MPYCIEMVALNAKPNKDGGFERRTEKNDCECRNWVWTIALKAELQGNDERKICPSVACYHNYQSTEMDSMSPKRHSASESEWSNRL